MALGLQDAIGAKLSAGVITAPKFSGTLGHAWNIFEGGHPLPNEASLAAAEAAFALLDRADDEQAVVIFLVSGGEPDGTTDILVSEAYRWAFTRNAQFGYAAAYAVIIFGLLVVMSRMLGGKQQ